MTTTTAAPLTATTAVFLLDTDAYVASGPANFAGTDREWADTFAALGGTYAAVQPAWRTGAPSTTLTAVGTDAAVAFARDSYALAAA